MKKLAIAMAVVFLYGMAGVVKGQETKPGGDPIGPLGGKQQVTGNPAGNGADDPTAVENGANKVRKAGEKGGIIVVVHPQNKGTSKLRKAGGTQSALNLKNGKGTTKNQIGGAGGTGKASLTNSTISGPGTKTNSSDIFTEKKGGKSAVSGNGSISNKGSKAGFDVFTKNGSNAGPSGNNLSPGATH